ncbi:MAG: sugar ABC transporter permease [Lachnospiraceae bacterium]|nr:sugar ABC transporter permease [Lachnospiraceae bacterium]MCR5255463.1 sugar ABC transporter permease [Acetatifactor sp.]
MNKLENKYYTKWLVLPAFLLFLVFFIIPNLASFVMGFTDWSLFYFDEPRWNGLDNFKRLFSEKNFWICVKNTFYFSVVTVLGKNILGFLMALLVQGEGRYKHFLRAAFFLPITISSLVVAIIFVSIYNPTNGLLNNLLSAVGLGKLGVDWLHTKGVALNAVCVMELWQQVGYTMCICLAGMESVPAEYYEASKIDGAGYWQRVFKVTIPLMVQSLTVSVMLSIISGIKVFAQIYGTTNGGPADSTQVLSTFLYKSFGNGYLGYSSAVGLFMTLLISVLTFTVVIIMRKKEVEM